MHKPLLSAAVRKPGFFALGVAALVLSARPVHADDDAATAQANFEEAKQEMAQGNYASACARLVESQRLDPGLGTQFHLANCWQRLGRTASAWDLFRAVEVQARALGQQARAQVAHDRAEALEPWLARLAILPPASATVGTPIEIRRDGALLPRATWATPVPVDPGSHTVSMVVPGVAPWQTTVELAGDGKTVTLQLPNPPVPASAPRIAGWLPPTTSGAPRAIVVSPRGVTEMMPPDPPRQTVVVENRGGGQRTAGWLVFSAGFVGLAAGGYFGARWIDNEVRASARCFGSICTPEGSALRHDGRQFGIDAAVIAGSGVAAMVVGAVLVSSAPSQRVYIGNARLHVAPTGGPQTAGMAVFGEW